MRAASRYARARSISSRTLRQAAVHCRRPAISRRPWPCQRRRQRRSLQLPRLRPPPRDRLKGAQGSAEGSQPNAIAAASGAPASAGGGGYFELAWSRSGGPSRACACAGWGGAGKFSGRRRRNRATLVDPSAAASGPSMPHDPSTRTLAAPGISNAAPVPGLSSGPARAAKPATTAQGQSISANSGPSFPEANALSAPASEQWAGRSRHRCHCASRHGGRGGAGLKRASCGFCRRQFAGSR